MHVDLDTLLLNLKRRRDKAESAADEIRRHAAKAEPVPVCTSNASLEEMNKAAPAPASVVRGPTATCGAGRDAAEVSSNDSDPPARARVQRLLPHHDDAAQVQRPAGPQSVNRS